MSTLKLEDIEITGTDVCAVDESVKLNGPPGTGKTTESAARVAELLDNHGYELDDVLWATYRHSLAMETIERLAEWGIIPESEQEDPSEGDTRFISTFHAVSNRLVGGIGDIAGYYHRSRFAGKRNLRFDKRNAWDEPAGRLLFNAFDYAANNRLNLHKPHERDQVPVMDDLRDKYAGDVGRAFDDWQDYKAQEDVYDFWEQLAAPLRRDITPSQDIVVIDEYHDATPLMAELAEKWVESAEVAIVAGDPLQVVNTYAGARPKFFNRVELPEVLLDTTHRVPEESWAVASEVLGNAHTPPPVDRKKSGSFHDGTSPRFSYSEGSGWSVPGAGTARSPGHIVEEYDGSTMFLTRTQRQAAGIAKALEKCGVLFETQNSMDIDGWGAQEDMAERTALYNALQRLHGVSEGEDRQGGLQEFMDRDGREPSDVRLRAREAAALLDHTNHKYLSESRDDVTDAANQIDNAETVVSGDELNQWVEPEFWQKYTRGSGSTRHLNGSANADKGKSIGDSDREAMKTALVKNDEPVRSVDTKVYTIHASKGTEARNVVVYDGITKSIENGMLESDRERKNEYRTWYVALTRADANTFVLRNAFEWTVPFLPESLLQAAKDAHERGVNA